VTFEATFTDEGPLGVVWSQSTSGPDGDSLAAVKAIKPGSVAEESDVAVGMLLGEIGGEDMRGVDYCEFNACCILCPALGGGSLILLRGSRRDPENPGDQTRDAGLFGRWQSGRKEARARAGAACVDY